MMASVAEDRQFIQETWEFLYGRAPTRNALEHHVGILQRGEMSRSQMLAILERRPDEIEPAVTRLFMETLGRAPNAQEVDYYGGLLRSGKRTRKRIRDALAQSAEALSRPAVPQDDTADRDALAYLKGVLRDYGLESLGSWAWDQIREGHSPERILQNLRDTQEYKQRFRGIDQRRQAGLPAISEAEYIGYESTARQMMRAAGLPADFYDQPDDFVNFIASDVSVSELQARINDGFLAASQAPPEVRDQLQSLYGVSGGALAAFFLDPDRALPVIERQFQAAQVSGAAARSGFGALNRGEAERLAELGISAREAQEGFSTLVESEELFTPLPGEDATEISREDQQAAIFEGDADARSLLRRRAESRVSQGSGAQSFAVGSGGVAALAEDR